MSDVQPTTGLRPSGPHARGPVKRLSTDAAIALALCLASGAAYALLALPLARTVLVSHLNLAFDFDPPFFVAYLTAPWDSLQGINYKHPLWALFRPFAAPILAGGFNAGEAAALAMAVTGGLAAGLAYAYARLAGLGRPEAGAAAALFAASGCSVFVAVIPESYGWANLSLALLWCVYAAAARRPDGALWPRLLAGMLVAGVTITNLVQALLAEGALRWRTRPLLRAMGQTALVGVLMLLGVALLLALLQPADLWTVLTRPLQTAKEVYWLRTKGDTVGLQQLLATYFVFGFFAPAFDHVALSPQVAMLDFRSGRYAPAMLAVCGLWLLFWLANVAAGLRQRAQRWLIAGMLGAVAFNLLFHLDYQFRGSVFIYASHLHFPLFALGLAGGATVRTQGVALRAGYTAVLLALALAAAWSSGQRVQELTAHMQAVALPEHAPEIDPRVGAPAPAARQP